jgi:peptide/nickel transport system permease protein
VRGAGRAALVTGGTVLALVLLIGALPWLRGQDPARTVLRARFREREADPAALAAIRAELGLPTDPLTGAWGWLRDALRGDLGTSWVDREPVGPEVARALGVSATLAGAAVAVSVAVAAVLVVPATYRSVRRDRPLGLAAGITATTLAVIPEVVAGVVLLGVVALSWEVLPTSGWGKPEQVVLPALALGLPAGALLARVLASTVDGALAEAWVGTWRANGVGAPATSAAVLRRAAATAVPQLALAFAGLLGSAVAVEQLFAVPGAGRTTLRAVLAQDLPLLQGCVTALLLAAIGVAAVGGWAHGALLGPARHTEADQVVIPAPAGRSRVTTVLVLGLLLAVAAGLPRDARGVSLAERLRPPSAAFPLGADALGRDVLARFGSGALLTVGLGLAVSAVAVLVGLAVALTAQHVRAGVTDVLNAVPAVLVGVLVTAVTGPGLLAAAAAVALVAWVPLAVHGRALVVQVLATGVVRAAVLAGGNRVQVLRAHVLPAVTGPLLRHAAARVPVVSINLAALSFLGLGAAHDSPEWGAMLAESLDYLEQAPWTVVTPVAGLVLLGLITASATTLHAAPQSGRWMGWPPVLRPRR